MFNNLKVVDLGDYVKVTSVKLKTSSNIEFKLRKTEIDNQNKLDNNLVRAKNKINDIALANDFKYFFTLTFNPSYDRYDLYQLLNKFRSHLRVMRDKSGNTIKYLIVPEQHKDGAWHFHGFFSNDIEPFIYFNDYGYRSVQNMDNLGYINIDVIRDKLRVSSYVTKYIVKNLGSGINKYRNSYFCSTGLNRGLLVNDKIYDNEYFNRHFFDWSNDFCSRKVITKEQYKKLKIILDKL